jgi:hypothetical protein
MMQVANGQAEKTKLHFETNESTFWKSLNQVLYHLMLLASSIFIALFITWR